MLRYALAIFLVLVLIAATQPWLTRLGLGRLPGDFRVKVCGRVWFLPFTSTLLLSALLAILMKVI